MNDVKRFKIALIEAGISMKDFCKSRNLDYQRFNLELNGFNPMKGETEKAITDFINEEEQPI